MPRSVASCASPNRPKYDYKVRGWTIFERFFIANTDQVAIEFLLTIT